MMNFKLILVVTLLSLAALFIAQNVTVVEIGFLYWRVAMSSALLIFFALMSGFVLGWLFHSYLLHRKARADPFYSR